MNLRGNSSESWLPFEPFLEQLRRQGFHIGVEHHLRLQQLLHRVAADCDPTELRTLLCPLFATSAEQQEFFHRTFDVYYPFLRATRPTDSGQSLPADQPQAATTQRAVRHWPHLAATGMAVMLLVAFLAWETHARRRPVQSSSTVNAPAPARSQPSPSTDRTSPTNAAGEHAHRVSPWLAWYYQGIALRWTVVTGLLLSWFFYEVYRFRRRRLLIRKAQGKTPPYSWPIRTDIAPDIYPPHDLAVVSRLLHRRYQGEAQALDVPATVEASIAALGFPTFRYRKDSRLPEYLFLIDRASFRDHQARLHEHLAAVLSGQGLYVNVYFYEGDPRVCWNSAADESVSLEQLRRAFSGYRLLLFGDGEQLLDAVTGRLAHWHRSLTAWPDRAVLTPEPPSEWGSREMILATQFALVPATLDGLASLAAYFELPSCVDLHDWLGEGLSPDNGPTSVVDALRRYLGEDTFKWLCACAIYPQLEWDLTLRIGALESLPGELVKEENLIKLLRLKWFRTGSMPDDIRRELIGQLDPNLQREVREAIISLLESNPPPQDTFAASARQFQIAFQRLWVNPKDRKARRNLKAALETISPDELTQDYAYLDAADSVSPSPLHVLLPSRLRKLIYPAGPRWFAMQPSAGLVLRHWAFCTLIAIASSLAAQSLSNVRFFQVLDLKAYDACFVARNYLFGPPPISNIVLLTADQKAMDTFPELQAFWNKHFAVAITAAREAGAKVIGLDLAFGIPIDKYEPGYDELLGGAVSSSPVPVVVGYVERLESNYPSQQVPINMIGAALGLSAFANLTTDPDGFSRRQELVEAPSPKPSDPPPARCLAMRTVEKYLGVDAEFRNGKIMLQGRMVPTENRAIRINYAGGSGTFPKVSLADFEAAAKAENETQLRAWVNGKIVLIGSDLVNDRFATPFASLFTGPTRLTAGVEIHANIVRTLLNRQYLVEVPQWSRVLALLLVSVITVSITITFSARRAAALISLEFVAILVCINLVFELGLIMPSSEAFLAASICLLASVVYLGCASALRVRNNSPAHQK